MFTRKLILRVLVGQAKTITMNNAINTVYGTNFCLLNFKETASQTLYKICKQQVSTDVNGDVAKKKVPKNSNVKFKGMLFRYKMNNRYETNMLLYQFI